MINILSLIVSYEFDIASWIFQEKICNRFYLRNYSEFFTHKKLIKTYYLFPVESDMRYLAQPASRKSKNWLLSVLPDPSKIDYE